MVNPIGGPAKAASVYGRQQYYAERAAELKTPKTVQVTARDRVSFSAEASTRAAAVGAYVAATAGALPSRHDIAVTARQIYYENPRKGVATSAETAPTSEPTATGRSYNPAFVAGVYADDQSAGEREGRRQQEPPPSQQDEPEPGAP